MSTTRFRAHCEHNVTGCGTTESHQLLLQIGTAVLASDSRCLAYQDRERACVSLVGYVECSL